MRQETRVTTHILTEQEALAQFRTLVATYPSHYAFAKDYQVDPGYLSRMLTGFHRLTPRALKMIGCTRVIVRHTQETTNGHAPESLAQPPDSPTRRRE